MSDGFERSTEFLPAFSREQIASQMQTIGSIEGRAQARRCLTTAREKGLMVRFRRPRHASHYLGILRVPCDPIGEAGGAVTVGGDQILGGRGITPAEGRHERVIPGDTGRRLGARGDDRLEHGLGTVPTTRAIRGFSVNADLCGRRKARGRPSLSCRFYSRPRSRSRISREGSRTSKRERDQKGPGRTGCHSPSDMS